MTEQVLKVLNKLGKRNTRSIIWVTLEQAQLKHNCYQTRDRLIAFQTNLVFKNCCVKKKFIVKKITPKCSLKIRAQVCERMFISFTAVST